MSATSIYVPSQSSNCLLPLLKRSAVVISKRPRLLSNQCLCWDSELVRVCICPLRVKYLFARLLWLSCVQGLLAFKTRCSGDFLSPWCRTPRLGSLIWDSYPSLFGENLCKYVYPPSLWVTYLGMQVLTILHLCPPPHLPVVSSLCL